MDFLWHAVSEKEKEKIKKEAKRIMDSFSEKLEGIDKKISEPLGERGEGEREEGKGGEGEEDFRELMFKNAPEKNKDFIIAEKKGW